MKTKNLLATATLCMGLFAQAQITPSTILLSSINYDASITHTREVWSTMGYTVYDIAITRDANNYITDITTSTPPPLTQDQSKTTGSKTGNVYTAITQKNSSGGPFVNSKRETWESDGTRDTCIWMETWNTATSTWNKSQKNVFTYTGSDMASITTYFWNSSTSAWVLSTKNVWTFAGGKMDRNDGSAWDVATSTWLPNGYFKYFYTGNKMDSMQQWSKDQTTSAIYLQYRFMVTSDANNKTASFTQMKWKASTSVWENSLTITYSNSATGVSEIKNNERISVYPTPANNELHINTNGKNLNNAVVKIISVDGKEVSRQTIMDGNSSINTSALNNGVYLLFVESEGAQVHQQKIMVAH